MNNKREPEFVFYNEDQATLVIYKYDFSTKKQVIYLR
jgi:hypothetical protein